MMGNKRIRQTLLPVILPLILVMSLLSVPAAARDEVTLRVWDWSTGRLDLLRKYAEIYQEDHPWVKFEYEPQGGWGEWRNKLLLAVASGTQPQITMTHTDNATALCEVLQAYPEELFPRSEMEEKWVNFSMGAMFPDTFYWMPEGFMPPMMFYLPEKLAEAGFGGPPKSWDEFLVQAKKLVKRDSNGVMEFAGARAHDIKQLWGMYNYQLGGRKYSADSTRVLLYTPEGVEAMRWATNIWHREGIFGGTIKDPGDFNIKDANTAIQIYYAWWGGVMRRADSTYEWDVTRVPTITGEVTYPMDRANYESGWGVPLGNTEEQELEAFKFLKWLYSQVDYHVEVNMLINRAPGYRDAWDRPELLENKTVAAITENIDAYIYDGAVLPSSVKAIIDEMWGRIDKGEPAQSTMEEAQKRLDKLMAREGIKVRFNAEQYYRPPF